MGVGGHIRAKELNMSDGLLLYHPKERCKACGGTRKARRKCEVCNGSGLELMNLEGLWRGTPGFLVCGGPSLSSVSYERLASQCGPATLT